MLEKVTVARAGVETVDDLRLLFLALHRHHRSVADLPLVADGEAWRARRARDELMRRLNEEHPGYGFASHKGYGTPAHAAAIRKMRCLSPVHRRSVRPKVYAEIGLTQAA